jgi:hypothetical protein
MGLLLHCRGHVCVCERERERVSECQCVCVCVCVFLFLCIDLIEDCGLKLDPSVMGLTPPLEVCVCGCVCVIYI